MAEEIPTTPSQDRKGLSKGCLTALIIVGVIVVLIIVAAVVCYIYKDELVKTGTVTTLSTVKKSVAENPPAGVDTARFNAITDSFTTRLKEDTASVNLTQFQSLMTTIQGVIKDEQVDSSEVEELQEAMFRYYPDLGAHFDLTTDFEAAADTLTDTAASQ